MLNSDFINPIIGWFIYGFIHSLLTFNHIKNLSRLSPKVYRMLYNIISAILFLITIYIFPINVKLQKYLLLPTYLQIIYALLVGIGGLIAISGLSKWNLAEFIGLKEERYIINNNGVYSFSRHPVYFGSILILTANLMLVTQISNISSIFGIIIYLILGSLSEEYKLNTDQYAEYKNNVGWMFPTRKKHIQFLLQKYKFHVLKS